MGPSRIWWRQLGSSNSARECPANSGNGKGIRCNPGRRICCYLGRSAVGDSSAVQNQLQNVRQVHGTRAAFAAVLADGSVVTWGDVDEGGAESFHVQDQLRNVRQVQATWTAFAAVLEEGSVVTWGSPHGGGDSSALW